MSTELIALTARLEQLERDTAAMKAKNVQIVAQCEQAEGRYRHAQRRLRIQAGLAFLAFLAAILLSPANRTAIAQGYGVTLASLNTRMIAVETRTQFQSA